MADETRYCPTCNSADLIVDPVVIQCKRCERILEVRFEGLAPIVDKTWAASVKRS